MKSVDRPEYRCKRAVDVTIGLVAAVVTLPILLATALVSLVVLRSQPFFTQWRIGRDGHRFRFIKIRTLPPATAVYASKYDLVETSIHRSMRIIRALHLDELPQFWLVVFGRMSIVGPRPEMPQLHALFPPEVSEKRASCRPGVTGLWQVGPHCDGLIHEHVEYDLVYIDHQTPRLDLWVGLATVRKILRGGVTTPLHSVPRWAWYIPPTRRKTFDPATVTD